jgi:hypothetical protein
MTTEEEYPQAIWCETCRKVVGFAKAHVQHGDLILPEDSILLGGTVPQERDPVCPKCVGIHFTLRPREET